MGGSISVGSLNGFDITTVDMQLHGPVHGSMSYGGWIVYGRRMELLCLRNGTTVVMQLSPVQACSASAAPVGLGAAAARDGN